jgi:hypothetical protein
MPCAMGILNNSPFSFLGNDSIKAEKDGLQGYFGVPQGCIVRNTFLEWQESEPSSDQVSCELSGKCPEPKPAEARLRRAQSCPQEIMMSTIRPLLEEGQHGRNFSSSAPATPANTLDYDQEQPATPKDGSENGQQKSQKKSGAAGTSLVLRGLPFNATEADVMAFIEQAGCAYALARNDPINLLSNQQGRPSGFAEIHLSRSTDFWEVQEKLHNRVIGTRYVEALPPRGKSGWGASPASRHATKRDSWRRVKGQNGDAARWNQSASAEWACWQAAY